MIHGIYLRNRPKNKWQLVSIAASPEVAAKELDETLKQAQAEGHDQAEVGEQVFDSTFFIPHYLDNLKEQKSMYN